MPALPPLPLPPALPGKPPRSRLPGPARAPARPRARARRAGRALALAGLCTVLTTALTACGAGLEEQAPGGKGGLVVGSAGFTESQIVAELYAGVLSKAGFRASVKKVKNRELYEPELEKGRIDVVPEYAATLAEFLNAKAHGPDADPVASPNADRTLQALRRLAEPRGLKILEAGRAVDQNAFAVSRDYAAKHHLKTLTDLGKSKQRITVAAGDECETRPFCRPGLEKTYGIDVRGIDPKGVGTAQSKQAVKDGKDQLVLTTTTDATLDQFGLVLLEDDKRLQNADNIVPVVNAKDAGDAKVARALDRLTRVLTTEDLTELNRKVDRDRLKPHDVAEQYLSRKGLV
ncbi:MULTISPECIES: ABC transporter substrate-binding protein [unclassified Streptomyces]|uniref:ABC transporter substrate-binding protein n=1 Tax=unclassified Streptomyces TaxID=2593676 RepID=UPI00099DA1D9|nr:MULTISPECIES: ABC transporter substrate-binding protein [unclassified Streptomyces]QHF97741.1 amino acid ABC transporter substrate-binding protein [Streptomyces sp. NHF165]